MPFLLYHALCGLGIDKPCCLARVVVVVWADLDRESGKQAKDSIALPSIKPSSPSCLLLAYPTSPFLHYPHTHKHSRTPKG